MKEEYFADDRVIIPEYIRKMSREELEKEIARLEKEVKESKQCQGNSLSSRVV